MLCEGKLGKDHEQKCTLYTMTGAEEIACVNSRCTRKSECGARYGYNYRTEGGRKVNCVRITDISAIFISSCVAFSVDLLCFIANLQYRGHTSLRAITFALGKS